MTIKKITIEALIKAKPQEVWNYWTEPEHITQWNFASADWHCPSASNDVRVGGKFKFRIEAKDGSFGFDLVGTYAEVKIPFRMMYYFDDGREVTTTFEDENSSTKAITTFEPETSNPPEMQQAGWQSILNNFKKYVEKKEL